MSRAAAILRLRLSTMPRSYTRSPLSRSAGEGPGVRAALTFPPTPFRSSTGRGRGEMSRAAAILRLRHTRSPLSRSAGEGLGVRAALTFPPSPCRSSTGRGRGDVGAGAKAWWPAHAMVGYARYEPHATSGFLTRLLERRRKSVEA